MSGRRGPVCRSWLRFGRPHIRPSRQPGPRQPPSRCAGGLPGWVWVSAIGGGMPRSAAPVGCAANRLSGRRGPLAAGVARADPEGKPALNPADAPRLRNGLQTDADRWPTVAASQAIPPPPAGVAAGAHDVVAPARSTPFDFAQGVVSPSNHSSRLQRPGGNVRSTRAPDVVRGLRREDASADRVAKDLDATDANPLAPLHGPDEGALRCRGLLPNRLTVSSIRLAQLQSAPM
jgi:hypothetical protein